MTMRSIPWVLAAAIGVMGAAPALACEEAKAGTVAHAGQEHGDKDKSCACGEMCECPMPEEKGDGHDRRGMKGDKGHGMHGDKHHGMRGHRGMRYHTVTKTMEVRYLPATGTSTSQHMILSGDARMKINDWFSIGHQRNLGIELFPQGPAGAWLTPYGGVLPRVGTAFGPGSVHVGALLGAGAMLRTGGVGNTAGDLLQARLMWVAEPRIELGWEARSYRGALVGTYLMTPNMSEFGGATVGLQFSFKGHPFKHW